MTRLGRMAVDTTCKGRGFGSILLMDALKRSLDVSKTHLGSIGVIVDPLDEDARAFYEKFGFVLLPECAKLFLPMSAIEQLGL